MSVRLNISVCLCQSLAICLSLSVRQPDRRCLHDCSSECLCLGRHLVLSVCCLCLSVPFSLVIHPPGSACLCPHCPSLAVCVSESVSMPVFSVSMLVFSVSMPVCQFIVSVYPSLSSCRSARLSSCTPLFVPVCHSVYVSNSDCLSVRIRVYVGRWVCLSPCLFFLLSYACLSVRDSLSVYYSLCRFVDLSHACLSVRDSLSDSLSVCFPLCLFVGLSHACLSVRDSVFLLLSMPVCRSLACLSICS